MNAHVDPATTGSNSSGALDSCARIIRDNFEQARKASRITLDSLRVVGETLAEAKELLKGEGKGAFGAWCDAQGFRFDKSWRARMMLLADHWSDVMAAVDAAPDNAKAWSLDGALGLWRAANKAERAAAAGEAGEGEEGGAGSGDGASSEPKETRAQKLERMLREALERIAALEAENAKLRTNDGPKAEKPASEAPKGTTGKPVDAKTRARAARVWALYSRPGTEGEKEAAKARLEALAANFGMDFDAFVVACGLAA